MYTKRLRRVMDVKYYKEGNPKWKNDKVIHYSQDLFYETFAERMYLRISRYIDKYYFLILGLIIMYLIIRVIYM